MKPQHNQEFNMTNQQYEQAFLSSNTMTDFQHQANQQNGIGEVLE